MRRGRTINRVNRLAASASRPINEGNSINLSAPTTVFFLLSLVVAILGLIAGLGVLPALATYAFWLVVAGYVILAIGCLIKGA